MVTEIIDGLEEVHGKNLILFRLAEAAVKQPHGVVSEVLFPVVDERILQALVREYHAKGPTYKRRVHTVLRSSYSHHGVLCGRGRNPTLRTLIEIKLSISSSLR